MEVEEVELINSSDEEEDDDMVALELLPNGRRDMRHAAVNMVVAMRGVAAMTRVGVRRAMSGADLVLRVNNLSLKQDVTAYLDRTGQRNHPRAVDLLRKFDNINPFHGIKSNQGQISGIKKYYDFIAPSTLGVGNRLDQRLVGEGGAYGMVEVPNTFEFCSVIEFLKMLLRKPEVMDYVRNRRPSENGVLESYMDGSEFREHPFFQNFPDAFQLVLYGDGVDPARMAGPKSGLHEMYCFSISVLNLPPYLFYSGESIFPMEIANAQDCTDTFEGVLTPFVNELLRLEEGVRVFIGGEFITLRATLVSVKGDGKAIHEMLGMLACSARHFCPQCMISRQELHLGEVAVGETRTPAMSDAQLQRVAQNPAYSTECGLRYRPVLHNSAYFRAENNGNFDLMHDGPEGVIMMVIRLCLRKWIVIDGIFTIEQLNGRITAFDYGQQNSKDKPTPNFTLESLQNAETTYTQKMNAGQTLVLFRALPFIIDNLGAGVDEDDEHLQYLLLLSEIFQTGSAPRIPQGVIPHLRRMLETFRRGWYVLFPNIHPINRFHHLMHLWENIERKGPQRQFWCFREEGKNCPVKRHVAVCNNFINPPKTAMEQCQIRVSKVWGTRDANVRDNRTYVRRENVYVLATPARAHLHALGFRDNDQISVCRAVTVWGFSYRIGEFLLYSRSCENNDGLPRFGRIVCIYCPDGTDYVWFALKPWRTIGLDDRFNAYSVAEFEPSPTHLVDVKDLPIHPAISRWTDYSTASSASNIKCINDEEVDGTSFVELNEQSLLLNFPKLNFGQRKACLKAINEILLAKDKFIFNDTSVMNSESDKPIIISTEADGNKTFKINQDALVLPFDEDLGCSILGAYVCEDGSLKPTTSSDEAQVTPCVSASFILKKKKSTDKKEKNREKKPKISPDDVEPLKVAELLAKTHEGQSVIDFITTKAFCDKKHQKIMMKIIYDHYVCDKDSPTKYYPATVIKIAMAKGIVTDFPVLADIGECTWNSWMEVVKTKFETVQSGLSPSKKKNSKVPSTDSTVKRSSTSSSKTTASTSRASSSHEEFDEVTESVENQIKSMQLLLPNSQNKPLIRLALNQSFASRRSWIKRTQPSLTEILQQYPHLASYEGEMICEEFARIEKFQDDGVSKFKRVVPYILDYAKSLKPAIFLQVSERFSNDIVKALVLLSKVLTPTLNRNTATPQELEHVKTFKPAIIESIPSSALFQIAPEGTDVDGYVSVETHPILSEQATPIFPFLLWLTNDSKTGLVYLKIDRKTFLVSRSLDEDSLLTAFDIFMKAHHVYNLKYHPYLRYTVCDYFEYLYGIKTPVTSVSRFITALKQTSQRT